MKRASFLSGVQAVMLNPTLRETSEKKVKIFLEKTSVVYGVRQQFRWTHQLLMNMRQTFENSINSNKARLMYMLQAYRKEIDNYRTEIAKSKDKTIKHLIKPLTSLEKTAPIELFKAILYRCKVLHSLAFFQWRYHKVETANKEEL